MLERPSWQTGIPQKGRQMKDLFVLSAWPTREEVRDFMKEAIKLYEAELLERNQLERLARTALAWEIQNSPLAQRVSFHNLQRYL